MADINNLEDQNIMEGLDPNSPYYEQTLAILKSPEHLARIEEQKRKIAEFKASQGQPFESGMMEGLDPNSPNYEQNKAILESPEHKARIEAQKQKIAEFKAAQNQPTESPENSADFLNANRLADAQKADNQQKFYATLLRSFQSMLQNSAPNSGFKADPNIASAIESGATAEQGVKSQMAAQLAAKKEARESKESQLRMDEFQLRLKKANLDFQDMEANDDPTSKQSILAQDRVIELQEKLRGRPLSEQEKNNIRQHSGSTLYKYEPQLQKDLTQYYQNKNAELERQSQEKMAQDRLRSSEKLSQQQMEMQKGFELRRIGTEERREKEGELRNRNQQITQIRGFLREDPDFKEVKKQSREFENVNNLLNQVSTGNQMALAATGTKLARAMGEVGVLTDTDVIRYMAGQSWGRQVLDWWNKGAKGDLSNDTAKELKANVEMFRKATNSQLNKIYDNAAFRVKAAYPELEDDMIRGVLGDPRYISKMQTTSELSPKDQEALDWANANPNDPRAAKIKERLGK